MRSECARAWRKGAAECGRPPLSLLLLHASPCATHVLYSTVYMSQPVPHAFHRATSIETETEAQSPHVLRLSLQLLQLLASGLNTKMLQRCASA